MGLFSFFGIVQIETVKSSDLIILYQAIHAFVIVLQIIFITAMSSFCYQIKVAFKESFC